jgi:hypothetical protein
MSNEEKCFKVKILVKKSIGQNISIKHNALPMSLMLEEISKDLKPHLDAKGINYVITEIKRINENQILEIENVRLETKETKLIAKQMYTPKKFNRSL